MIVIGHRSGIREQGQVFIGLSSIEEPLTKMRENFQPDFHGKVLALDAATGEATELSDSLVAVDARTGAFKWADQVTEHDVWTAADRKGPDYDFAGGPQLFEATIDGQPRLLVGAGQKSGLFHAWDAATGEKLWATSIGYGGVDGGMHGEA